jgi:hypothetical protein
VFENTILDWGIDSIFTITVDNASSNDAGLDYMKRRIKDKNSTILEASFFTRKVLLIF